MLLGLGPLSCEIIEAVYRMTAPVMLIASKNQIDHSGGYVNNWTTSEYRHFLDAMEKLYPNNQVLVCRDHCGPGFNGVHDLKDCYATVEHDVLNSFDLIHFDFCHYHGDKYGACESLIKFALDLDPSVGIEIGTDENTGDAHQDADRLRNDIDFFRSFCSPDFYVVQTGSLVSGIGQAGTFDAESVAMSSEVIHGAGMRLKEHNADYLPAREIARRKGLVDAMNVAPQLGVVQTMNSLAQATAVGIDIFPFLNTCYASGKWRKWVTSGDDKFLCAISCGHYNFSSPEYLKILDHISREKIIDSITTVINTYTESA